MKTLLWSILVAASVITVSYGTAGAQLKIDHEATLDFTNHPVIFGDTETIGDWSTIGFGCGMRVRQTYWTPDDTITPISTDPPLRDWDFLPESGVSFLLHAKKLGRITGSTWAVLEDKSVADGCPSAFETWTFHVKAFVISDSMVLIRPKTALSTLTPDSATHRWWSQDIPFTLRNKVSVSTSFSQFKLIGASIHGAYGFEVRQDGALVDSVLLNAEENVVLVLRIWTAKGPIDSTESLAPFQLGIRVRNQDMDSEFTQSLRLQQLPAGFNSTAYCDPDSIGFQAVANVPTLQSFMYHKDSRAIGVSVDSLEYPFSVSSQDLGDSIRITISCFGRTTAWYNGQLAIHTTIPDYNGDLRMDSSTVKLHASVLNVNDTVVWTRVEVPLDTIRDIKISPIGAVYVSDRHEIFASYDGGLSWVNCHPSLLSQPADMLVNFAVDAMDRIYLNKYYEPLSRSTDHGATWTAVEPVVAAGNYGHQSLVSVMVGPDGEIYGTGHASKFDPSSFPPTSTDWSYFIRSSLKDSIWTSATSTDGALLAVDSSSSPIFVRSFSDFSVKPMLAAVAPDQSVFLIDSGSYIWRFRHTLLDRAGSLIRNITSVATLGPGKILIATDQDGAYVSTDGGKEWDGANGGLSMRSVSAVASQQQGYVFLGTNGHGLFRSLAKAQSAVLAKEPASVTLAQNYPNPFQSSTTVGFALPRSERVTITVQDMLGRTLAIPINGMVESGPHIMTIDGASLPNGIYSYTLRTDSYSVTRKMSILR